MNKCWFVPLQISSYEEGMANDIAKQHDLQQVDSELRLKLSSLNISEEVNRIRFGVEYLVFFIVQYNTSISYIVQYYVSYIVQ